MNYVFVVLEKWRDIPSFVWHTSIALICCFFAIQPMQKIKKGIYLKKFFELCFRRVKKVARHSKFRFAYVDCFDMLFLFLPTHVKKAMQ